jgi:glycosyltransferase involved in cell wall biosynthesis
MINITYLIPLDSIGGGVEVAAKGVRKISNDYFKFNVEYIYKDKKELFNFFILFKAIVKIYSIKPEVLILSLWRSQLVGVFIKLILPRTKVIFFVHSAEDAHFLDYILSRLTLFIASEVWGDSVTSLKERFKYSKKSRNGRVISFSARNIKKLEIRKNRPNFIFWGRIGREKGLDRSIIIFSKILKFYPQATFTIIGSDGGTLNEIKAKCEELKLDNSVNFYNEMDFFDIEISAKNASFYLQTSLYEGAAMSVMESMKLGLVPIVTPVGEISRYCNRSNSVIVRSNNEVVRDVVMILQSEELYDSLSLQASLKFKSQVSYVDSIVTSSEKMVRKWF